MYIIPIESLELKHSCSEKDSVEAEAEETLLIQRAHGSFSERLFNEST